MLPEPTLSPAQAPGTRHQAPTFLAAVAADLLARYEASGELSDLVVIVPTRRAVVYLKNELARATPAGQALWAPRIAAMEDYMVEQARVQLEEPIALQLLLYDVFREFDPELGFDSFTNWGGLLLQDFSALDQNLADTKQLFAYLAEAKALERWQLNPDEKTTGLDRYFGFWGQLHQVYLRFKTRLRQQHLAYPGLAYRRAVQHLAASLRDAAQPLPPRHVFVGLGQLSRAEERFIGLLRQHGRAEVRFDADPFYLEDSSPNRAGQALRQYYRRWNLPHDPDHLPELLRRQPRHVRLLGVANASTQGKLAGQLLAEALARNPAATVAVVLPDETLLLPVLHGLPPAEVLPAFNVTMGLSFQSTALFNFVDLLFEVHLTGIREGQAGTDYQVTRYHHLAVTKLLAHPFLRRYQAWLNQQPETGYHHLLDDICQLITERHMVLLAAPDLLQLGQGLPLFTALFKPWADACEVIEAFYGVIEALKQVYQADHRAIEAEYLYLFYTLVRQLDAAFDRRLPRLGVRVFRRFLYEQMRRTRLPFAGEPLAQVQVMGLLETRALDFDHVIVLSCNEGTLPAPKRQQSLFPYDVLTQFQLPTYAEAEAGTAYNFWRLLQRAARVDLLHVLPGAEGVKAGERSRFLRQLTDDLAPQNPALVVEDRVMGVKSYELGVKSLGLGVEAEKTEKTTLNSQLLTLNSSDLTLAKDPPMLAALRGVLERGLSPSALNEYLACTLQFYFSRLARFKESEEVEEALDAAGFGTVVHNALENLLKPFETSQRPLTAADLPALLYAVPAEVQRQLLLDDEDERQARTDDGLNHVLGQVAVRLIRKYLESLPEQPYMLPLHIAAQEYEVGATVFVDDLPDGGPPLPLRLLGRADRVDLLPDGRRRVVDYKTGLVKRADLNLRKKNLTAAETVERLLAEPGSGPDKVRQLWLYRFMLESAPVNPAPPGSEAAILSLRNINEGLLMAPLSFITEALNEPDFLQASAELLRRLVRRILDPAEPIRKTDDLSSCEYCPYRGICAR